jgi:hypothetical protein
MSFVTSQHLPHFRGVAAHGKKYGWLLLELGEGENEYLERLLYDIVKHVSRWW